MSMSNLARLMPLIMEETVEEHPRWARKAKLLRLVAMRTEESEFGVWTELGLGDLAAYGSSYGQARWDHHLLRELCERHRILSRISQGGTGRRPDTYRIRGDRLEVLAEWRHLPWKTSARRAIASLRANAAAVDSVVGAVFPGQEPVMGAATPPLETSDDPPLSVKPPRPSPEPPRPSPNCPGESPDRTNTKQVFAAPITEKDGPPSQCLKEVLRTSHSLETETEREGEVEQARNRLQTALEDVLGVGITGEEMLRRIDALARAHVGQLDVLVTRADRLRGTVSINRALANLEAWTPAPARPAPRDTEALRVNLRRLIATFEDKDPDYADRLREDLAALDENLGAETPHG